MQVTIDVSPAVNGKAGLGRYARTLAKTLAEDHPAQISVFANTGTGAEWPDDLSDVPRSSVKAGYKVWRMAVLVGQISRLGWERFMPRADLFHATEHLLLPMNKTRTVLTVHDLIYRLFPEHHKKLNYWYLNLAMPVYCRRADHIIAVSQSTRDDLVRHYRLPEEKITVVYEAAAEHFVPQTAEKIRSVRQTYRLPDRYLVTVGTIEPRKNYARLVGALAELRKTDPDLKLVVVGAKGWLFGSFFDAIKAHQQEEAVILPGYVPDEDLPAVLAGAKAAVIPSLYEGFGLPVLEAMACGTPVACSKTSSLGEIAGEAALTFDPERVDEIVATVKRILEDEDLSKTLIEKGHARAQTFSWERAARETWAVYEKVLR